MKIYIALLRGINVGGHKKIPMADLRELLTKSGLINVKTYIQSGNVIFQSKELDSKVLENKIQKAILSHFGFDVPVLVKSKNEIESILNNCPFPEEKKMNSYFIILNEALEKDLINETSQLKFPNEAFVITKNCIYIFYTLGAGKAKLGVNWFERKLKITATARNYKTMVKLLSLSS
ncbi:DUF1697 domain-containing protein [uncultured Algibacter sp.]|uniref:DUF1697 domain-containing protein n=1 Tax=uncultured Algibacter sp. TaxID=298659 RepID=UPI0026127384|nr:DUF1697 domain-containing protein [uncultured Algibacter sp.]